MENVNKKHAVVYEAEVLVCDYRFTKFLEGAGATKEALELIKKYSLTIDNNNPENIESDTTCVPIMVSSDSSNRREDWTRFGSSLSELSYGNLVRYWPKDWLFKPNGSVNESFKIVYPNFEIHCTARLAEGQEKQFFADIVYDKDIMTGEKLTIADVMNKEGGHNMGWFNNSKKGDKNEKAPEERKETLEATNASDNITQGNVVDEPEEKLNEKQNDVEVITMDEVETTKSQKKPMATWKKVVIGVAIGAAVGTAGYFTYKHFAGKKSEKK